MVNSDRSSHWCSMIFHGASDCDAFSSALLFLGEDLPNLVVLVRACERAVPCDSAVCRRLSFLMWNTMETARGSVGSEETTSDKKIGESIPAIFRNGIVSRVSPSRSRINRHSEEFEEIR